MATWFNHQLFKNDKPFFLQIFIILLKEGKTLEQIMTNLEEHPNPIYRRLALLSLESTDSAFEHWEGLGYLDYEEIEILKAGEVLSRSALIYAFEIVKEGNSESINPGKAFTNSFNLSLMISCVVLSVIAVYMYQEYAELFTRLSDIQGVQETPFLFTIAQMIEHYGLWFTGMITAGIVYKFFSKRWLITRKARLMHQKLGINVIADNLTAYRILRLVCVLRQVGKDDTGTINSVLSVLSNNHYAVNALDDVSGVVQAGDRTLSQALGDYLIDEQTAADLCFLGVDKVDASEQYKAYANASELLHSRIEKQIDTLNISIQGIFLPPTLILFAAFMLFSMGR